MSGYRLPTVEVATDWKIIWPHDPKPEPANHVSGAMAISSCAFCTDHPLMASLSLDKCKIQKGPDSFEVFDPGYDLNIPIQHAFARSDTPAKNLIVFDASASEVGKQYWASADAYLRTLSAPIWDKEGESTVVHKDGFLRVDHLKNDKGWNILYFSFVNQKGFSTLKQEYTHEDGKKFFEAMGELATAIKNDEWTDPDDSTIKTTPTTSILTALLKGFCGVEDKDLLQNRKLLTTSMLALKYRAEEFLKMYNENKSHDDFADKLVTKYGTFTPAQKTGNRKRRGVDGKEAEGDEGGVALGSRNVAPTDPTEAPNALRANLSTKYDRGTGALIASGGGIRAEMFTAYLYYLLQDIIPICVSEMYGLSGSTWAMGLLQFHPPTQALVRALKGTTDFVSTMNMFKSLVGKSFKKKKNFVMRWWRSKIDVALFGATPGEGDKYAKEVQTEMKLIELVDNYGEKLDKYAIRPIITAQALGRLNNEDFSGWVEFRPEGIKIISATVVIKTHEQQLTRKRRGLEAPLEDEHNKPKPTFGKITACGPNGVSHKFKIHGSCRVDESIIARAFSLRPGAFYLSDGDCVCGFDMVEDGGSYKIVTVGSVEGSSKPASPAQEPSQVKSKTDVNASFGRITMNAWDTLQEMSELGDFISDKWQTSGSRIKKLVSPMRKLSTAGVLTWDDVKKTTPQMWESIGLPTALKNMLLEEANNH